MKGIFIFLFFIPAVLKAESVKDKTIGLTTIENKPMLEFEDSAHIYPFEPVYDKQRLALWVGYVDTNIIKPGGALDSGTVLFSLNYRPVARVLTTIYFKEIKIDFADNPGLKKIELYFVVYDNNIIESSRMERRLEKVLKAKKKSQWKLFEQFKTDFEFTDAILTDKYNLHFSYDERSPGGKNDFRLVVFTDSTKHIIAVANDGYRKIKLKAKITGTLDRGFTIYYLVKLPGTERKKIEDAYLDAFRYRD